MSTSCAHHEHIMSTSCCILMSPKYEPKSLNTGVVQSINEVGLKEHQQHSTIYMEAIVAQCGIVSTVHMFEVKELCVLSV